MLSSGLTSRRLISDGLQLLHDDSVTIDDSEVAASTSESANPVHIELRCRVMECDVAIQVPSSAVHFHEERCQLRGEVVKN